MFLAGAGSAISNMAHPKGQAHGMGAKMAATDAAPLNQPGSALPCPALSSPLSVSSHTGAQSGSGSSCTDDLRVAKPNGVPTTPMSKAEPPRIVSAVEPVAATAMMPSGTTYSFEDPHIFSFSHNCDISVVYGSLAFVCVC